VNAKDVVIHGSVLTVLYFHGFIVPKLKEVVTQYKMWNEVMVWFTQTMYYNVYTAFTFRANKRMMWRKILALQFSDVIDPTVIFCELY